MSLLSKSAVLLFTVVAAWGVDNKNVTGFHVGPATSYPNRQSNDKVIIAAVPYVTEDQLKEAFGKLDLRRYGICPILVVIQNDSDKAITLESMKVELAAPDQSRIEATPASDIRYINGGQPPKSPGEGSPRLPIPIPRHGKKNPLDGWEVEGRAFAARMLPAGQAGSGFFYFQSVYQPASTLYITGIRVAGTNHELFYYEIPLAPR